MANDVCTCVWCGVKFVRFAGEAVSKAMERHKRLDGCGGVDEPKGGRASEMPDDVDEMMKRMSEALDRAFAVLFESTATRDLTATEAFLRRHNVEQRKQRKVSTPSQVPDTVGEVFGGRRW